MINWGIIGCGKIARTFADAVNKAVDNASLKAAAARDANRAKTFAKKYNVDKHYGSYEELVQDPEVDAVYIATPHSHHRDHTILCLENNKPVLCEKAFAINTQESREMIKLANEKNLFLMEAMWMRFLPHISYLKEIIKDGELGNVLDLKVDFSFKGSGNSEDRLLNPTLAGGALLDVGIYPLTYALLVFDQDPVNVKGTADIGNTGVDESNSFTLHFSNNRMASCTSSVVKNGSKKAEIKFENGFIEVPDFWQAQKLKITKNGSTNEVKLPFECNGFEYEIRESVHCLKSGKIESDTMPTSETIRLMGIMDNMRQSWGLKYPME